MSKRKNKKGRVQAPVLKRPELGEAAAAQIQDRYSGYPSNGLSPVKLAEIFKEADAGDVLRQSELFEEMEEKDPHLFSQLQTRKQAVTGLDFEIIPFDPDNAEDKEIAEFISMVINDIENFEEIEMDLLDAIGKGFAVSEIIWDISEGCTMIKDIRSRHQKRFYWDSINDKMKVRTALHPEGEVLRENKFIIHRYKARSGHPSRAGVLRVVAWMYLFKNYNIKDWISFCEVYGLPLRLGKYAQGASEKEKAALMKALVQIGADAAGIIPDGSSIEFINTEKAASTDLFEGFARYADEQISKAVLGQTLTSDSGGGSFAQSKTHNEVRHDLTVADCKALAATIRRDLVRPLVIFNYGEAKRIPFIKFDCKEAENLKESAEVLGTLIEKTGLKVPTGYIYKKFAIPKPKEGEETAQPPQVSAGQTYKDIAMKAKGGITEPGTQARIDLLTEEAIKNNAGAFSKMLSPLLQSLEAADSLEDMKESLNKENFLQTLLKEMEVKDFEELLQRAMVLADLEGRAIENGRD